MLCASRRATASLCVLIAIAALAASSSLSRARSASVSFASPGSREGGDPPIDKLRG